MHQLALIGIARDDGPFAHRRLAPVQAQLGLAGPGVRAMAGETVFRQNRPDIAVELDGGNGGRHGRGRLRGPGFGGKKTSRRQSEKEKSYSQARFHGGSSLSIPNRRTSHPRSPAWRINRSVASYASRTHSTIRSGCGEYSNSMLTAPSMPSALISRR